MYETGPGMRGRHSTHAGSCASKPVTLLALQVISPFNIYYNTRLIYQNHEYWRLATNFFFYGNLSG